MVGDSENRDESRAPFSIRLLGGENEHAPDASQDGDDQLLLLLPASYRTESGDLVVAARHVTACIEKELDLHRLAKIHDWLWLAGLPVPPRQLSHQLLIGREVVVTERMEMHLVWTAGRLFLKPIPRFLLEPRFWTAYLRCASECGCSLRGAAEGSADVRWCEGEGLRRRALGFLFSYAALITHESDFRIALARHLLPPEVAWPAWRTFTEQLNTEHSYRRVDPRFYHGELRLSRLNKIYALSQTPLRGYLARYDQYGAFFHDHFAWLASATVLIAVILTAMQVGLATETLAHNGAFQSASYGFTVFSILMPLVVVSLVALAFVWALVSNWIKAFNFKKDRLAKFKVLE